MKRVDIATKDCKAESVDGDSRAVVCKLRPGCQKIFRDGEFAQLYSEISRGGLKCQQSSSREVSVANV